MGNFFSSTAHIGAGDISLRKPTAQCALLDLPFELIHTIFSIWLRGKTGISRELIMMDKALCNRAFRPILLQMYHTISFGHFFVGRSNQILELKMKWSLMREITFTEVTLNVICDVDTMISFFIANAETLKAVHITNNEKFDRSSTNVIARHCTKLETLCIVNSSIYPAFEKLLRKCPLKRFQFRESMDWLPLQCIQIIGKSRCPSLLELSILDVIEQKHTKRIAKAFPNVTDFEMMYPDEDINAETIFTTLFSSWKNLHTLKLCCMEFTPSQQGFDAIGHHCPHLEKLHFDKCNLRGCDQMVVQLVERTTMLTSLTVNDGNYRVFTSIAQVRIVETMNKRLKEFCIGTMCYDDTLLQALARYAPNLVTLELLGINADGYKSTTMIEIYQNCRSLRHLHLFIGDPNSSLFFYNDHSLVVDYETMPILAQIVDIGTHCKNIHTLLFQDSFEFRVKDVHHLVEYCPKLQSISTNNTFLCREFRGACRGVRILYCEDHFGDIDFI